jgi:hypothetical protein
MDTSHDGGQSVKALNKLWGAKNPVLAAELRSALQTIGKGVGPVSVLDIGCGDCPYGEPLAEFAALRGNAGVNLDFWDHDRNRRGSIELPSDKFKAEYEL